MVDDDDADDGLIGINGWLMVNSMRIRGDRIDKWLRWFMLVDD